MAEARRRAQASPEMGMAPNMRDYVMTRDELQFNSHMQNFINCVRSREQPICGWIGYSRKR
jgi:hypothetical protein